jgi:hypothetical protein
MTNTRNRKAVPDAKHGLETFKYEIAYEIGVKPPETGYWGNMTSRECGSVGGYMVKKMVQSYEQGLTNK